MRTAFVASAVLASVALAQDLSSQCITQVGLLAIGDLGTCLAITNLLPLLNPNGNESLPTVVNTYLTNLCQSDRERCSNSTLESASTSIQSACAADLESTGSGAAAGNILESVLESYPQFYTAACSRNETTNSFCVTSTLQAVQNATGQTLDINFISSILGGSSEGLGELNEALDEGQLCTGCVAGIYRQAVAANASIANIPAVESIRSRCGEGFGTSAQETGVSSSSLPSGSASAGASSSSAASQSPTSGAGPTAGLSLTLPAVAAFVAVVGGVFVGGAAVL